jgi:predicted ArsR family transcriptional regulator
MKQLVRPTRGKIIACLRGGERTVNELVAEVGLTDNAVRSHLEALGRQGLVYQSGFRAGLRKPHHLYKLTAKAEQIFFQACEPLLSHMLAALALRVPPRELKNVLRDAGRRMADEHRLPGDRASKKQRIDHALALLKELGGKAALEQKDDKLIIQSTTCPWSIIVAKHSEVCLAAEALLSELIGIPVKQHCLRGESPRCSFHLQLTASQLRAML